MRGRHLLLKKEEEVVVGDKRWRGGVSDLACMGIPQKCLPVDTGPLEESQDTQQLSWSFLPYLFSFLFMSVVQDPW